MVTQLLKQVDVRGSTFKIAQPSGKHRSGMGVAQEPAQSHHLEALQTDLNWLTGNMNNGHHAQPLLDAFSETRRVLV